MTLSTHWSFGNGHVAANVRVLGVWALCWASPLVFWFLGLLWCLCCVPFGLLALSGFVAFRCWTLALEVFLWLASSQLRIWVLNEHLLPFSLLLWYNWLVDTHIWYIPNPDFIIRAYITSNCVCFQLWVELVNQISLWIMCQLKVHNIHHGTRRCWVGASK